MSYHRPYPVRRRVLGMAMSTLYTWHGYGDLSGLVHHGSRMISAMLVAESATVEASSTAWMR